MSKPMCAICQEDIKIGDAIAYKAAQIAYQTVMTPNGTETNGFVQSALCHLRCCIAEIEDQMPECLRPKNSDH